MKEVLSILTDQSAIGYLATVDDGKPRVRPWGFMFEENGRLYFCTASTKDVYRQLTAVPYIEYSKTTKDMVWVRVSGEIIFDDDIRKKELILERAPMLKKIYESPDNPIFKIFYLEHGKATINDFSPNPPRCLEF
ncbi:pyridoxamine 5'-phosphate oxidase family protein [Desulfosporosinus sp. Sb-LF]|uniref:pyridoxamine 5'-phosphate oxidase family protein n=1 Tax=Desulfosporosinus sp. Sb-LF TaxID=2560027 RepID=UPI00107FC53F|nr:pyridoxamine 5'-phosphate oxidase family protein [Desulfosporosinus sp. Sb-LF]TGE32177.1 pyridoxamine 5'-phosphate oxidase [Desulfosporosinus sp. Sb-LF]